MLHDLNQACRYADYLVAITSGRIYTQGTPTQIMTEKMIQQVFMLSCRIITDPVVRTPMGMHIGRKKFQLNQIESQAPCVAVST